MITIGICFMFAALLIAPVTGNDKVILGTLLIGACILLVRFAMFIAHNPEWIFTY